MKKIVPGFIICAASILYASCSDEYTICESPVNVSMNAGFYESNGSVAVPAQPASYAISTLSGSQLHGGANNSSTFSVPLSATADTSSFVISIAGASADTFKLAYTTSIRTVSANCGDINIFNLQGVVTTHHTIDSIVILNRDVNTALVQNIKVCY